jgi:hypothetical protein
MDIDNLRASLAAEGLEDVLRFWEQLSEDEKKELYEDLQQVDPKELREQFVRATESESPFPERRRRNEEASFGEHALAYFLLLLSVLFCLCLSFLF